MVLSKIKSWFSNGGRYFNEDVKALEFMNKASENFELTKATSARKLNQNMASLNINNDLVSSIRLAYERGVIGTQISIQSRTEDEGFNTLFEDQIKEWSKRGNCELTGRFYRGLAERSMIGYNKINGGFILIHHYNKKWDIPYKFEIVPLTMIDYSQDNIMENKINGLKINNYGELKGVYIYTDGHKTTSKFVSSKDLTLYVIPFVDPTQYSGVSSLSPIISTLDMLSTYNVAELRSAKNKAEGAIVVKTQLFNEILKIKQQRAKSISGGVVSENELFELYKHFKITGGLEGANYVPADDDVVNLQSKTDSIFDSLDNSAKRTISAGAGLSTQTTFREMPSSYNAALLNAQLDDAQFEIEFMDFTEMLWREVIEVRLLDALVLSGKIKITDFWTSPQKYRKVEFIRKSSSHIDPSKVEKAITDSLDNGTSNQIDIIATKGKDWQQNIKRQVAYEIESIKIREQMFKEAGVDMPAQEQNTTVDNNPIEEDKANE